MKILTHLRNYEFVSIKDFMHLKQSYANIQHKRYEFRGTDTVQIPSYLLIIGRLLSGRSLHSVYSSVLQLIHSTTPIALNETPKKLHKI